MRKPPRRVPAPCCSQRQVARTESMQWQTPALEGQKSARLPVMDAGGLIVIKCGGSGGRALEGPAARRLRCGSRLASSVASAPPARETTRKQFE